MLDLHPRFGLGFLRAVADVSPKSAAAVGLDSTGEARMYDLQYVMSVLRCLNVFMPRDDELSGGYYAL